MIATAFFTGYVKGNLNLIQTESEGQYLSVFLLVKKGKRKEMYFYLDVFNADALNFKQKVSVGDLIAVTCEPYSTYDPKNKEKKSKTGFKIILFEVLKKGEIEC
jgi:hypothetical protein